MTATQEARKLVHAHLCGSGPGPRCKLTRELRGAAWLKRTGYADIRDDWSPTAGVYSSLVVKLTPAGVGAYAEDVLAALARRHDTTQEALRSAELNDALDEFHALQSRDGATRRLVRLWESGPTPPEGLPRGLTYKYNNTAPETLLALSEEQVMETYHSWRQALLRYLDAVSQYQSHTAPPFTPPADLWAAYEATWTVS